MHRISIAFSASFSASLRLCGLVPSKRDVITLGRGDVHREVEVVDEFGDFVEGGAGVASVAGGERDGELGRLPEVVIAGLGDRDAEDFANARLEGAHDLALILEGMAVGEVQPQAASGDDSGHGLSGWGGRATSRAATGYWRGW